MKFTISSSQLSLNLQAVSRVISSKNTLPILDYFLFQIEGNTLKVTASDLETTLQTTIAIENLAEDGAVAVPAKRLTDSIKEFSEQPLTIEVNKTNWEVTIIWQSGKLSIPGASNMGYPEVVELNPENTTTVALPSEVIADGIANTIFATADDPLRPVMNGINVALTETEITFVATDAHRLVRLQNTTVTSLVRASFILPQKPAQLLRTILPKDGTTAVELSFDQKNVIFNLPKHKLVCRLIEGNYPNYNAVIPKNNDKKIIIDRLELLTAIKRVSVCSNQASGLIQFSITTDNMKLTAQDVDFATSAEDNLKCQYIGENIEIGFKSAFLQELLAIIHTTEVEIQLADSTRSGLFLPVNAEKENQSLLMLLMPMAINA